jgi:hypothetical protein
MHPFCIAHLTQRVVLAFVITLRRSSVRTQLLRILVTATMLVGGRDCRTQFWKGITHGPFHQSLVLSGQVVSKENIFSKNILSNCVRTDDRRKVMTKANTTLWVR